MREPAAGRVSRRRFLSGLGALSASGGLSLPSPARAATLQVANSTQLKAAMTGQGGAFTKIELAPGIYDSSLPIIVNKVLEVSGPPDAILRCEFAVFDTTLSFTGPTFQQRIRTTGDPRAPVWEYQPAQISSHNSSIYVTDFTATADVGATKQFIALEGSNLFIRARAGNVHIDYKNVASDVIRNWYRSQCMTMSWDSFEVLIEGGIVAGGIIHAAGSIVECRDRTILRGIGLLTASAILGNLGSTLLMTGAGRIEDCNIGMRAVRGSTGWLDPTIALSNVRLPVLGQLGGVITR